MGGSSFSTFLIDKNLVLLGGFTGTECDLSERDIVQHPTILSGDLNGNDVPDDFDNNRSDNVTNVIRIGNTTTAATVIDGFTISGGHADLGFTSGGGLHSLGAPVIRNCVFEQNYASAKGGALYLAGSNSQGVLIENCLIQKNSCADLGWSPGLFVETILGNGVTVNHCEFSGNIGGSGSGLSSLNANLTVKNSTFTNNMNIRQGAGVRFWADGPDMFLSVDSCTFKDNHATIGGGLYAALGTDCSATITNSNFEGNSVTPNPMGWWQSGGGIYLISLTNLAGASFSVDNCLFQGNTSTGEFSAAGVEVGGINNNVSLTNSIFRENESTGYFATMGVWTFGSGNDNITIENCLIENNVSVFNAGLGIGSYQDAGPANFQVRNCQILNNQASIYSGGLYFWAAQNSAPTFLVEDCQIIGNSADERAGGVWIDGESNNFHATLNRCIIQDNNSPWGSAFGAFLSFPVILPTGASFSLNNSLITGNTGGGAIALDSFPGFQMLNTTVADNAGSGLVLSDSSGPILQNTILFNNGNAEFEMLTNDVTVTSNGGNLIGDGSLDAHLIASDKPNADPLFVGSGDYHVQSGSPCVDMGVDAGNLPALDLGGNPRVLGTGVDIGAYESMFSPVREVIVGQVSVSPNPVAEYLNIQLPETISSPVDVQVFDLQGKLVLQQVLPAGQNLNVFGLAPGVYSLKVLVEERVYVGRFVKH